MAQRLNLLFQTAPRQYLERTVLFTDQLGDPKTLAKMAHKMTQHVDIEPLQVRSSVRILQGLHEYQDTPLSSYVALSGTTTLIPKTDPPFRFVFLPEFTQCRLLVQPEENDWLKLHVESNLVGRTPPAGSPYVDSFSYWDETGGLLVGRIRASAVLVKEPGEPWAILMQQIVGTAGHEVVRSFVSRTLRY